MSIGLDVEPRDIDLRFTADFYDVEITNAVNLLEPQVIVDNCFSGNESLCALIERDEEGNIKRISRKTFNSGVIETKGFEVEIDYKFNLPSVGGEFGVRGFANRTFKRDFSGDGVNFMDLNGELGGLRSEILTGPKWRFTSSLEYNYGRFSAFFQTRVLGGGKFQNNLTAEDISPFDISARAYLDISGRYIVDMGGGDQVELFTGVNNLLDKDPPILGRDFPGNAPTNKIFYDVVGRFVYGGVKLRF